MGCVQQAVLEFDEEVRAPWRPRLVSSVDVVDAGILPAGRPHSSRRSPSRVGACRPPEVTQAPEEPARHPAPRGHGPASEVLSGGRRAPARRPAPRRGGAVGVRLTRRARRLAVLLALAAGVALGSWLGPLLEDGSGGDLRLAGESGVVVRSGDTLWSIATSLDGEGDLRALVDEIQRLNGLDGSDLVPGQVLEVP